MTVPGFPARHLFQCPLPQLAVPSAGLSSGQETSVVETPRYQNMTTDLLGKIKLPFTSKMCLFQSERAGVPVMGTSLKSREATVNFGGTHSKVKTVSLLINSFLSEESQRARHSLDLATVKY